ncbi:TPA: diaminopimelate decarboxylase [Candidatus Scatenecus faecavium]|uniref:Diaminopimelate decarboxylase n=1 Tax=Candidatus Scatenecus faecavium TaxID=2840915 RepID=A0A9D1FVZ7_9BACT|nr:diaminopimelate decarboxylase [Candidatus Scatenecus faecavium]
MESTNQFLKPITLKTNANGNLEVGGCDVVELAEKYGTPLYVIDEATLRGICKDYKKAFSGYEKINMMFASKSLCTMATSAILAQEGFGFDVVSAGEIYTVYKAGVDMSKVLFNGNNKSFDELTLALELGVGRISVDNFFELALFDEIAKSQNKTVDILLRITPGIECHTHEYIQTGHLDSKFGFDLTQIDEAVELILNNYTNLRLHGLHAHIGSQIFETKVYHDEIEILIKEIARLDEKFGLKLDEINVGGGLGVKYTEEDLPPSTFEIAEVIINSLNENIKKYGIEPPALFLEPGRSIISTAGITLYTIGSSKQVPHGKKYVAVDGGMADNPRPSMYQAKYSAEIANKKEYAALQTVTIAGRFCESGDILIKNINLPEPVEGDILCVYNTGAYNYSMASNYNRVQKPQMVIVNNSKSDIIINRETLEDLISHDIVPDRLK